MSRDRFPTFYLCHGGGPWPYMDGPYREMHGKLERSLADLPARLGERPKAILVVTAHWETRTFMVGSAPAPGMIYDYSGFPEHTYHVRYAAPGEPAVAHRARALLEAGGHVCGEDANRGLDHGTFCMLQPIYPDADVPVAQISIRADLDPAAHIDAGRRLAPLRDEGVLILGSGLSYHNLAQIRGGGGPASHAFDGWLQDTLVAAPPSERTARLESWSTAPGARASHPREDHLLPLMVVVGAAEGEAGTCVYHQDDFFGTVSASSFQFGA